MTADRRKSGPVTSPGRRLLRLGGLVGRVGVSVAAERTLGLLRSGPVAEAKRLENLIKNALRITETLGEMKGAAMKVGQMLSLQEGWLPPEVAEILRRLQREAPRVPPEVMRYEVEGSLQAPIDELFGEFDERAFAAASIGQVHAARLADGRRVAVKIQYPAIREIVIADLKNLERLFRSLFAMVFDADFEPLWEEMRDRLLEELDYDHEAENMRIMRDLHEDVPEIVIPKVIDSRSTDRVLTMEFLAGIAPRDAVSDRYDQDLRNRWGRVLFEFQIRGLFQHRMLHADPNFANFSFLEDGRMVVYDFGSVKRIPDKLASCYSALLRSVIDGRPEEVPEILRALGATRGDGSAVEFELLEPYLNLLADIFGRDSEYRFGEDPDVYEKIMQAGMDNWTQATDLRFPQDVILVDRSLAGHFGNLMRLGARGPWTQIVERYIE
ncbi:MAG: AarF/ABC1/UbiB kinase family protein [Acidobacteria bacterium]|nr:AarF/ABC1/UbiB kinase family protein [Acidobacteriota bacterium]